MTNILFNEFAALMALTVLMGFVAMRLRQPLILSFIIVGIIAGPAVLGWISSQNEIEVLASFGITLLLFIVGLKLDLDQIKSFGSVVLLGGIGQIVITTLLGALLGLVMGFPMAQALFIAFSIAFSSTIIIIKLLSDNYELDSLYGRISVGLLIVQDLVVVIAIIVMSSLSGNEQTPTQLGREIVSLMLNGIGLLAVMGLLMRFVFPSLLEQLAKSRELLILFAFAWAVLLAVGADALGFGKEVGGFLAGVTLASSRFREAIASRLEPVRNLLLLFFFLNLGASLHFEAIRAEIIPAIVFSLFVLIAKPIIVMIIMGVQGFRKRTGFLTGLSLGQVSEFSLILAAFGVAQGYINEDIQSLITFIGLISIACSSYLLNFGNTIYCQLISSLKIFERQITKREDAFSPTENMLVDVIVYGFGRHGENIALHLQKLGFRVLGIDFDPRKIRHFHHHIWIKYGDAEDVEFAKHLPLNDVKWVVSTIPHLEANQMLVSSLKEKNYKGKIAISVYRENDLEFIRNLKVDMVLVPYADAAISAAERLAGEMLH